MNKWTCITAGVACSISNQILYFRPTYGLKHLDKGEFLEKIRQIMTGPKGKVQQMENEWFLKSSKGPTIMGWENNFFQFPGG